MYKLVYNQKYNYFLRIDGNSIKYISCILKIIMLLYTEWYTKNFHPNFHL